MPRFVCLDFETNGFPTKGAPRHEWTLPFCSYPIQLSVDIVDEGVVHHAYDALIRGATQLAPWVRENVPITLNDLHEKGKSIHDVIVDLATLLQEGDTVVAHNAAFDLDTVLGRTSRRLGIDTPELDRILTAPRFCTMRCAYSKVTFSKQPKMQDLCNHFEVRLDNAHDARGDSAALAACVAEAWRRGIMF